MNTASRILSTLFIFLSLASVVLAGDENRIRRDKENYRRLSREWQQVSAERSETTLRAIKEAKANGGKTRNTTLAHLANLIDRQERIWSHLLEISLRNGWSMPQKEEVKPATSSIEDGMERILGRAKAAVRQVCSVEARAIARALKLPPLPISGEIRAAGKVIAGPPAAELSPEPELSIGILYTGRGR